MYEVAAEQYTMLLWGLAALVIVGLCCESNPNPLMQREFVIGNEIPRIVAHRCIIEASIGKRIVLTIEAPHSPGHRSNHRAAQEATLSRPLKAAQGA
jgi:hypothetical protein